MFVKRLYLVVEVAFVAVGLLIGYELDKAGFSFIPRALISLPSPDVFAEDFVTTAKVFLVVHLATFLVMSFFAGPGVFRDARRTAVEIYGLIFAVTLSSLALFLLFTIIYSPALMLSIAVVTFGLFIFGHVVIRSIAPPANQSRNPLSGGAQLIWEGIRHIIRPTGILVLIFTVCPLILAKMFVSDRDFANQITQIRIFFAAAEKTDWALVNSMPGTTFLRPIEIQFPPNDRNTIFVLERDGGFYKLPYTPGQKSPENKKIKLLDLAGKLGQVEIENGALGFDHHPEFGNPGSSSAGFIYVYYTSFKENRQINYLSRFDVSLPTLEQRMASESPLLVLGRNNSGFHNGGSVEFGPDGYLYISLGEAIERPGHQRLDHSLFGGISRIDVDRRGGNKSHAPLRQPAKGKSSNYFIPNDNPFVGQPNALEEFWALGLRNPFRASFDPKTGELWAGDVGSDVWEEVNRIQKGGNYQYPYSEGRELLSSRRKPANFVGKEHTPTYVYRHTAFDRAVIGGIVYRGKKYPSLVGKYIFADSYSGKVWAFDSKLQRVEKKDISLVTRAEGFSAQRGVTSVHESPDGDILLTALGQAGAATGQILRVLPKDEAEKVKPQPSAPATQITQAAARGLFLADCARCHGRDGKGDGPDAKSMIEAFNLKAMPDFTSAAYHDKRSDADIERIILKGGTALGLSEGMPPWEGIYSATDITALREYMRSLRQ